MSVDSKTNILIKWLAFRIWRKRKRDKEPHVKETWLAFCCLKNLYAPTEPHLTKLLKFSMSTFYFTYIIHTSGDIIRQRKIAHTREKSETTILVHNARYWWRRVSQTSDSNRMKKREKSKIRIQYRKKMFDSPKTIVMSKFAKNFVIFTRKLCAFIRFIYTHFITICNANMKLAAPI